MSIIAWNCRGLANLSVVPKLKYLIRYYKPDALFLSETLVHSNKTDAFRYLLGFDNCFSVSSNGRSGGLALFWRASFSCTVLNYSDNHINVEVNDLNKGKWQFTGYYGFPEGRRRRASWDFLRNLANNTSLPWCILGDFNDILDVREKRGGALRPRWLINGLRQAVSDAGLTEVYMKGYPYTWFKSLGTPGAVEVKLDRGLANADWFRMFPNVILENLVAPASYHYPLLLKQEETRRVWVPRKKKLI